MSGTGGATGLCQRTARRLLVRSAIAAASVAAAGVTLAAATDVAWDASGRYAGRVSVAANGIAELCSRLPAGSVVSWRFESSRASDFNIHYHQGEAVTYAARGSAMRTSAGTLSAESDQHYCWMWRSPREALVIDVELSRQR